MENEKQQLAAIGIQTQVGMLHYYYLHYLQCILRFPKTNSKTIFNVRLKWTDLPWIRHLYLHLKLGLFILCHFTFSIFLSSPHTTSPHSTPRCEYASVRKWYCINAWAHITHRLRVKSYWAVFSCVLTHLLSLNCIHPFYSQCAGALIQNNRRIFHCFSWARRNSSPTW